VPYSVNRYDFRAVYLVGKKYVFGANLVDLTDDERKKVGRNVGVRIDLVVKGTPAYLADLFADDIVLSFDGEDVRDVRQFIDLVDRNSGRDVDLVVLRDRKKLKVTVALASH